MLDPKYSRKEIGDAVARGVHSSGELPFGPQTGRDGDGGDPESEARLARIRAAVTDHFSRFRQTASAIGPASGSAAADSASPPRPGPAAGAVGRLVPPGAPVGPGQETGTGNATLSIPTLHLYGPPAERARQAGALLAPVLGDLLDEFLRRAAPSAPTRWGMDAFLALMTRRVPRDLQVEIRALARAAGVSTSRALALTLMGDFHAAMACSTIVVEPPLAAPESLVFGRNLDFIGYGLADVAAVLAVHHPAGGGEDGPDGQNRRDGQNGQGGRDGRSGLGEESGEIPYASLGWAGLWGTHTGWNAAGLCLGNMQAYNPKPDSPTGPLHMLSGKTPTSWAYTRLLRSCRTVREALAALDAITPLSPTNLMLADATGESALVEWDIQRHRVRRAEGGRLFATNYYIHPEVRGEAVDCWRMNLLEQAFADLTPGAPGRVDAAAMSRLLDSVNQGDLTLHSIVFEPKARRIRLAASRAPSSEGPWETIPWNVW